MRQLLAVVLAKFKDMPLTLDVARQIVDELDADHSIDPRQFAPKYFAGYVLQCERVAGNEADLDPLHSGYKRATRPHLDPADPFPYSRLRANERAGEVLQAVARNLRTNEMVGVMRVRIS